jgi:hypothetical protein
MNNFETKFEVNTNLNYEFQNTIYFNIVDDNHFGTSLGKKIFFFY